MQRLPMKRSVFRRLLSYFLCVGLIPVVLLMGFAVIYANATSINTIRANLTDSTERAASLLKTELEKYYGSVEQFCVDEELVDFLQDPARHANQITRLNQKLYLILAGRADLLRLYITDREGTPLLSSTALPQELQTADPNWGVFRALRFSDRPILYADSMTMDYRAKEAGITVGGRVMGEDALLGYVLLHIPQSAIQVIIKNAASDLSIKHLVLDSHGYLIVNQVFDSKTVFLPWEFRGLANGPAGQIAKSPINGDQVLLTASELRDTGIRVASAASVSLASRSNASLTTISILLTAVWAAFCFWISRRLASGIVEPIQQICSAMEVIEKGNLDNRVHIQREDEFAMMASGLNHMVEQLNQQFMANLERQNRLRIAELKNLQTQITPHFLYNTLESIKWLARLHMNAQIETIVEKLGILLKSGMNFKKDMIPLRDEINVVNSYLAIQQIRYDDKLSATIDVPEDLLCSLVPNLVIQPLVENAVVHCVEQTRDAVHVTVRGYRQGDSLTIAVSDNGGGIPQARLAEVFQEGSTNHDSIGLVNVHRRLRLYFGQAYGLQIESKVGEGTTVYARMPFRPQEVQ